MKFKVSLLCLLFSCSAQAQLMLGNPLNPQRGSSEPDNQTKPAQPMELPTAGVNIKQTRPGYYRLICPKMEELTLNADRQWEKPPYWKSYQTSLSPEVGRFVGAQWTGAAIGNLFCLYNTDSDTSFPNQVTFSWLVEMPRDKIWVESKSEEKKETTTINCVSRKIEDCVFAVKIKTKDPRSLIDQAAELYRKPGKQ